MLWLAGLVCSGAVLVFAPAAAAGNVSCEGTLSGPINGNVVVPKGAECSFELADVSGNVTAQTDATVSILGSTVGGNYICNNCEQAHLETSTINGNFEINGENNTAWSPTPRSRETFRSTGAAPTSFFSSSTRNEIGGNLLFNNNEGLSIHHGQHDQGQSHMPEQRPCSV